MGKKYHSERKLSIEFGFTGNITARIFLLVLSDRTSTIGRLLPPGSNELYRPRPIMNVVVGGGGGDGAGD